MGGGGGEEEREGGGEGRRPGNKLTENRSERKNTLTSHFKSVMSPFYIYHSSLKARETDRQVQM